MSWLLNEIVVLIFISYLLQWNVYSSTVQCAVSHVILFLQCKYPTQLYYIL